MKKYYLFILLAYLLGIGSWALVGEKFKVPTKEVRKETFSVSAYPNLPLDVKYFNENDVWWGLGDEMAAIDNKTVFQSYPTTDCTIQAYSIKKRKIETKSLEQALAKVDLLGGLKETWAVSTKEAYDKWGSIVTHYLPDDLIENIEILMLTEI